MTGREVHLMVRGDVNPLLARIAPTRSRTSRSRPRTSRTCSSATTAPGREGAAATPTAIGPGRPTDRRRCRHDRVQAGAPPQPLLAIALAVSLASYAVIMGLMYPVLERTTR